jgi:hypothetical protein
MISGHGYAAVMPWVVTDESPAAIFFGMLQDRFPPGGGEEDGVACSSLVFGDKDAMDIPVIFGFECAYQEDIFLRRKGGHIGEANEETLTGGGIYTGLDRGCHAYFIPGVEEDAGGEVADSGGYLGGLVTGHDNELADTGFEDMLCRDGNQGFSFPGE